jgi:hypothetical protein
MTKLAFLCCVCLFLVGCSSALYRIGETISYSNMSETYWGGDGSLIVYAGEIADYGFTYVRCDRYFAFASLLRYDPKGLLPPEYLIVATPRDLQHCTIVGSEHHLSPTEIAELFGIPDDLVPGSERIDRYRVTKTALYLHTPMHRFLTRPGALFLSWLEPTLPYPVAAGGRHTRDWDKSMYGVFLEATPQQVEELYHALSKDGLKRQDPVE